MKKTKTPSKRVGLTIDLETLRAFDSLGKAVGFRRRPMFYAAIKNTLADCIREKRVKLNCMAYSVVKNEILERNMRGKIVGRLKLSPAA